MIFSDTSNLQGLIQSLEFNTKSGTAGISGDTDSLKNATRLANNAVNSAATIILDSLKGWQWDDLNQTNLPILTADLVSAQQDYAVPGDILTIYRMEVSYDGTNWYKAEPIDLSQYSKATDSTSIANNFSKTEPYYDVMANSVFLYPIPDANVTGGLKIWEAREISKFASSDTTKEPGIDDPFHQYIEAHMAYNWERVYHPENAERWKRDLLEMEQKMRAYYGNKEQDTSDFLQAGFINFN